MTSTNRFILSLGGFYGATFLLVGVFLPFFSVWLKWKGLDAWQISVILAAPLFVRLVFTPGISYLADLYGDHSAVIRFLAWGSLISLLALFFSEGFGWILLVSVFLSMFWTTIMPLTETVAMKGVRESGLDYGRMRLWGSLTFILASTGVGAALDYLNASSILWFMAAALAAIVGTSYFLPGPARKENREEKVTGVRLDDIVTIIKTPAFLLFLIGSSAIQATHSIYYSFGSLHWQALGIPSTIIGTLWAIGVLAEIVLFAMSGYAIAKLGAVGLLLAGAIGALVRWTAMAFDPGLIWLFPLQILHALTFGAGHLGAVHFISQAVPDKYSATAQGLYASFSMGLVMGLAMLMAGPLYENFNGMSYLAMSVFSVIALLSCLTLARLWNGKYIIETTRSSKLEPA